MILVTFQAADAWLLDDIPNGGTDLTADLPGYIETGLTKLEARTPLGDTLRLGLSFQSVLDGADKVTALRNALQDWTPDAPCLCPLWPAVFEAGDAPTVVAEYYVLIGDDAAPEIKTHAQLPFARQACPLLVGRLSSAPEQRLQSDSQSVTEFSFVENSALHITPPLPPGAVAVDDEGRFIYGDDWLFGGFPVCPFDANWAQAPLVSGSVDYQSDQIGEGRVSADQFFAQPARRTARLAFTLSEAEPWQLLSFFRHCAGVQSSFWLPSGIADARLTADVLATDTALTVADSGLIGDNRRVLITDGVYETPALVSSTAANTLNLSTAVGRAFEKDFTRIESLVLTRFATPRIKLHFEHDELASAQIVFTEVPHEMAAVAGETAGTTHGALTPSAYLYVFTIPYPGAPAYSRYTDFERDLTYNGSTFTAAKIEHGEITESDSLDRNAVSLKAQYVAGQPLALFFPMRLEYPLKIDIYEATVGALDAVTATRVFSGEVDSVTPDPPNMSASCSSLGALFDRRIPVELFQRTCNTTPFSSRCGLAAADWTWTGLVTSYDEASGLLVLNTVSRSVGPLIALPADRFAGGMLVVGAGSSAQRRAIATNTALVGTDIGLTVGTPFTTAPTVGATVTFNPGCPGRYGEDCTSFYNNAANFRGFPFLPLGSPSQAAGRSSESSGAKK